jgi:alpha-L-rhamnosidase
MRGFLLTIWFAAALQCAGQTAPLEPSINPVLLAEKWPAWWIAHPTAPATEFGVFHFRKHFSLATKPECFVVHVSADNRYRLFVNGTFVAMGPAQSDLLNWRFETIDIGPHLRPGLNVIAAVVWNGGLNRPMAQISHRTGFILQGDGAAEQAASTDASWKVFEDPAYAQVVYKDNDPALAWNYYVAGALERVDATRYPWGWQQPNFEDAAWPAALQLDHGAPYGVESHQRWQLRQRSVPLLSETLQRFARVARSQNLEVPRDFVRGSAPLRIPSHIRAAVLLDNGTLTTGYPVLRVSGGKDSQVRLIYGEALYDDKGLKGNRDEIQDKHIMGVNDIFLPDGAPDREYQPLWTRNWRWVQLEIETAGEPLTINDFSSRLVTYPAQRAAVFESDSDSLRRIWDAGWRTLALDAQENFISDVSWERLQYIADTKVQALSWLVTTGDDRLVRLAIEQFDQSRVPFGLTQSRYPANLEQFIPTFSLYWVSMVYDYWLYRGDDAFVRQFLPGVGQVLWWFEDHTDPSGLRPVPWLAWSPIGDTFLFALTLQESADLFERFGKTAEASHYRHLAAELNRRTYALAFDRERGLVRDAVGQAKYSQEVNSLAILSGAVPRKDRSELLTRMLTDNSVRPAEMFSRYYLGRSLKKEGFGDRYLEILGPWEDMLRSGMQTFGEQMLNPRSDCHPWSTSPVFELLSTVAGIEPGSPGFQTVRIEPALGTLRHVHARMPHRLGPIEVWLERTGGDLRARVSLPPGLAGVFVWKGQEQTIRGTAELRF